ncbi:MAG: PilT/PilU family type 4a pilus ATPase [Candidatus Pacebacteria bacterium]|nr:PilT/PilU family type 4a pilus ATPase [Candidatus Paceibacterota bacterium]
MNIHDILQHLVEVEGSDVHVVVGSPPILRVHGKLMPVEGAPVLNQEQAQSLIHPILTPEQKNYVQVNKELDFGYQFKDQGRFRVNVYHTKGNLAAALRLIPARIRTIEELNLPQVFHQFTQYRQGLVLVTGPTGEGKSTTLAALIDEINSLRAEHIVTIEDPIEFVYQPKQSLISQREINHDTNSWEIALRSVLREDPDVVLIGEMRDFETIAAAITIAETGHLVFATLHTASAAQTIDRIIDVFPAHQQGQVRQQLAATIAAVASQRLLPNTGGTRTAAFEIMLANSAISNLIREAKAHQIDNVIQTSANQGMMLMETHLYQLVQQGVITAEMAKERSFRPAEMERLLGG